MNVTIDHALFQRFRQDLNALPGLRVTDMVFEVPVGSPSHRIDALVTVDVRGTPVQLAIEVKAHGSPRDMRAASEMLEQYLSLLDVSGRVYGMIVAPAISKSGRDEVRRRKLGYWDTSGSLYLELPVGVYYVDRGEVPPRDRVATDGRRSILNPFRGVAQQVLHALLIDPDRPWHTQDLAARARVSIGTVHHVFTYLEEQLWVDKRGRGPQATRVLREPGQVLDAWATRYALDAYRLSRGYRWSRSLTDLQHDIARTCVRLGLDYALTLDAGAALVAPFVTHVDRLSIVIPPGSDVDGLMAAAEVTPVDDGESVAFLRPQTQAPLLFTQSVGEISVVSPVQLYLDLSAWPMRGKEQAAHVRTSLLPY